MVAEPSQVVAVHLGTRPDCLSKPVLRLLEKHARDKAILVEIGLQTANETTLHFLRRMHGLQCFQTAVGDLHAAGLPVCAHVILGLPTPQGDGQLAIEGIEQAAATADYLAELEVEAVKLHNCQVLLGTALAELYDRGQYIPPDFEGYLQRLIAFLKHLPERTEIHRLVGEATPPLLIAPEFTAHKAKTLQRLRAELELRGIHQGSHCQSSR
jgi:radical SAM protein (TIGR01212 family)